MLDEPKKVPEPTFHGPQFPGISPSRMTIDERIDEAVRMAEAAAHQAVAMKRVVEQLRSERSDETRLRKMVQDAMASEARLRILENGKGQEAFADFPAPPVRYYRQDPEQYGFTIKAAMMTWSLAPDLTDGVIPFDTIAEHTDDATILCDINNHKITVLADGLYEIMAGCRIDGGYYVSDGVRWSAIADMQIRVNAIAVSGASGMNDMQNATGAAGYSYAPYLVAFYCKRLSASDEIDVYTSYSATSGGGARLTVKRLA